MKEAGDAVFSLSTYFVSHSPHRTICTSLLHHHLLVAKRGVQECTTELGVQRNTIPRSVTLFNHGTKNVYMHGEKCKVVESCIYDISGRKKW